MLLQGLASQTLFISLYWGNEACSLSLLSRLLHKLAYAKHVAQGLPLSWWPKDKGETVLKWGVGLAPCISPLACRHSSEDESSRSSQALVLPAGVT